MNRSIAVSSAFALVVFGAALPACSSSHGGYAFTGGTSSSNGGSVNGLGGATGGASTIAAGASSGGMNAGGMGGILTSGGANAGGVENGGASSGGTSAGGASSGGTNAGGASSGGTNAGGASSGGSAGANSGGTTSGGSAGTGGSGGAPSIPPTCDSSVAKSGACTTAGSVCSKTCGPDGVGYKTETCTNSVYVESACQFPPGDYSCYQKDNPLPACTGGTPTTGTACTDPACGPCGPNYLDSSGNPKTGACVCTDSKWSCASDTAWPPQDGALVIPPGCDSSVSKGGTCTTENSVCSKTCGPKSVGYKTETCTTGHYVESTCMYDPSKDYSCFQLPTTLMACDPSGPVTSGTTCTVADCEPCGPDYLDSTGSAKTGYCVCGGGPTNGKWSCASASAWP